MAGARVHADVSLVPGEGPEHEALLHGLGDAREPLLDPLQGDGPGHQLGGDVEQRAGAVSPAHQLYVGGPRGVMMEHHRHGVLQPNKMQIMGGSDLALQLNGWYLPIARDMISSLIAVSPKIQVGLVPGSFLPLPESGVFVGAVALVAVLAARTLPPRHLQQYWNILNRYIDTSHPPPLTVSSHAACSSHWRWSRPRTTWCRCPCYEQPPGRDMSQ